MTNEEINNEEQDLDIETITITLHDNSEMECHIIGIFDALEREYIALLPVGEEEALIYRYTEDEDGEVILDIIEDDSEFDAVANEFYGYFEETEEQN